MLLRARPRRRRRRRRPRASRARVDRRSSASIRARVRCSRRRRRRHLHRGDGARVRPHRNRSRVLHRASKSRIIRARTAARGRAGRGRSRSVAFSHGVRNTRNASSRDAIGQKTSRKVKKNIATRAPGRSNSRARASVCQAVGLSVLSVPRPMRDAAELTDIEPDDATVDPRAKINYDVRERCARRPTRVSRRPGRRLHRSVRRVNRADDGRGTTETDRTRATTGL